MSQPPRKQRRENQSTSGRELRKIQNRERHQFRRDNETTIERELRRAKDRERHRFKRESETAAERESRLHRDSTAKRAARIHIWRNLEPKDPTIENKRYFITYQYYVFSVNKFYSHTMDKLTKKKKDEFDIFSSKRVKQEDLEVTGVSRSGRVRKKSSKLTDFESPDEIDNRYKRRTQDSGAASLGASPPPQTPHLPPPPSPSVPPRQRSYSKAEPKLEPKIEPQLTFSDDDDLPGLKEELSSESDSEFAGLPHHPEGESSDSLENGSMDEDMDDDEGGRQDEVSAPSSSLYMMEKATKKKLMIKDGKVIGRIKTQRKDKGKTRYTAYMLWAKEVRQTIMKTNPEMDFATMSKRLGELWSTVPNNEKYNWKRRAKRLAVKGNLKTSLPQTIDTTRWKAPPVKTKLILKATPGPTSTHKTSASSRGGNFGSPPSNSLSSPLSPDKGGKVVGLVEPVLGPGLYKVVGTQPVDVAAHLKLLGESLSLIGERLKEHEGQIAVSGSLSVLLDSLLCALGPLTCLTQTLEETNGCSQELLSKILDNIAYFMPGL